MSSGNTTPTYYSNSNSNNDLVARTFPKAAAARKEGSRNYGYPAAESQALYEQLRKLALQRKANKNAAANTAAKKIQKAYRHHRATKRNKRRNNGTRRG